MFAFSGKSHATLIDLGGGLIYDDDYDITWLQDANYAGTTMNWSAAVAWAEGLVFGGYDGWRLPITDPEVGGYYPANPGVEDSEMGHLYYTELGNTTTDNSNTGPFINIQSGFEDWYWSGTNYQFNLSWYFSFYDGEQLNTLTGYDLYAWAVHDGRLPEPSTIALFSIGLFGLGLGWWRKKRKEV